MDEVGAEESPREVCLSALAADAGYFGEIDPADAWRVRVHEDERCVLVGNIQLERSFDAHKGFCVARRLALVVDMIEKFGGLVNRNDINELGGPSKQRAHAF